MKSSNNDYMPATVLFVLSVFFGLIYIVRVLTHLESLTLGLMYEYEVNLIIIGALLILTIATLVVELTSTLTAIKKLTIRIIFTFMAITIILFFYKENLDVSKLLYEFIK